MTSKLKASFVGSASLPTTDPGKNKGGGEAQARRSDAKGRAYALLVLIELLLLELLKLLLHLVELLLPL